MKSTSQAIGQHVESAEPGPARLVADTLPATLTTRRTRVLALSYLFPNNAQPGYGIFVLNRLRAVAQLCDVKVIAPVQWYPLINRLRRTFWTAPIDAYERQGSLDVYHPTFAVIPRYMKWIDALTYLLAARRIAKQLRRRGFEYDIVDVHWTYPDIVAGWFLARPRGKKYFVTVRGHEALYDEEITLRRWLVAFFLRRADFVVALSSELRGKLIKLGVAPERVGVILNGVDVAHFSYIEKDAARRALGIDAEKRVLLSVGRLTAGKGHDILIQMMPMLARFHDVDLYIVGGVNPEDDFGAGLLKLITDLQLTNVHLLDKVPHDKLRMWYGAADLFCLASHREGCPNVVLEALACGAPVVTTRVGAIEELVERDVSGLLVDPAHLESFGEQVRRGLTHTWDRARIADGMTRRSWEQCAQSVVAKYRAVLGESEAAVSNQ